MKFVNYETENEIVKNHKYINDVLIYDIETDSLNTNTAKMKFIGFYSYKYKKYMMFSNEEKGKIQKIINEHRILVGFNNKKFDDEVLQNSVNNIDIQYKICFDCLRILYNHDKRVPNRENWIKMPNGKSMSSLPNRKIKTIAKALNFPLSKGDIDYKVFKKDSWTEKELKDIYEYLAKDIAITRRLFEFYVEYFDFYKEYVDDNNIRKFNYIRTSFGSYAYSVLSHLTGMKLEFGDSNQKRPENHGGFVLEPQTDYAEGTIIYADFASLYPHIMFMCNLFNPCEKGWKGGELFTDLQSCYNDKNLGKIETVLKDIYNKRLKLKAENDIKEQALKVVINTIYGLSGSPVFKNLFNMTTSGDCTIIGRQILLYTKKVFEDNGFSVIYGDTDSCFIHLPVDKTIEDFEEIALKVKNDILSSVPFPVNTFKLDIDDLFVKVWLFKKKNYIGINKDNKLIIKGLSIIRHDASKLGVTIFEKLKPRILESKTIKFSKEGIKELMYEEIQKNISIVGRMFNVREASKYSNETSIQAQISKQYGEGSHFLIKNKKIGCVGKINKYCTIEEAKNLNIEDLELDKTWKELDPFIS